MDEFLIWCAGFFDGEGSVSIPLGKRANGKRSKDQQFWLQVTITQNVRDVLIPIQERFGGRVTPVSSPPDKKMLRTVWRWVADGERAAAFLQEVMPHLRVKRRQAEIGIKFQSTMRSNRPTIRNVASAARVSTNRVCDHTIGRINDPRIASAIEALGYLSHVHSTDEIFQARMLIKEEIESVNKAAIWVP